MTKNLASRRIDQWLFYTRLVKSRSLGGRIVESGKVRVNKDKIRKAAAIIRVGDVITAMINRKLLVIRVESLGIRRGPSSEAIKLYCDITPVEPEKSRPGRFILNSVSRPQGSGRPTKKDRRKIDSLKLHPED